jgi:hypothetical protein
MVRVVPHLIHQTPLVVIAAAQTDLVLMAIHPLMDLPTFHHFHLLVTMARICLVTILLMAALRQVQVEMPSPVTLGEKVMKIPKTQEEENLVVLMRRMV